MSLLAKVLAHRAQSPAPRTELAGTERITALPQAAYAGQERYSERLGLRGRSITLYAIQERALEAAAALQPLLPQLDKTRSEILEIGRGRRCLHPLRSSPRRMISRIASSLTSSS